MLRSPCRGPSWLPEGQHAQPGACRAPRPGRRIGAGRRASDLRRCHFSGESCGDSHPVRDGYVTPRRSRCSQPPRRRGKLSEVEHTIEHMADGATGDGPTAGWASGALGAVQAADREIARQTAMRARAVAAFAAARPASADRPAGVPGSMSAERRADRPPVLSDVSEWAGTGARARPRDHQPGGGDPPGAVAHAGAPVAAHPRGVGVRRSARGAPVPDARAGGADRESREAGRDRGEAARLDDGPGHDAGAARRQGAAAGAAGRRPRQRAPAHRGVAATRGLRPARSPGRHGAGGGAADRARGGRADRRPRPVRRCSGRARRRPHPEPEDGRLPARPRAATGGERPGAGAGAAHRGGVGGHARGWGRTGRGRGAGRPRRAGPGPRASAGAAAAGSGRERPRGRAGRRRGPGPF